MRPRDPQRGGALNPQSSPPGRPDVPHTEHISAIPDSIYFDFIAFHKAAERRYKGADSGEWAGHDKYVAESTVSSAQQGHSTCSASGLWNCGGS